MLGVGVSVSMAGILATLEDLIDAAGDLRPVWPALAREWADRERRVFAGQGSNWAPFSSKTLIRHAETGRPPMIDKGTLFDAMTDPAPRYSSAQTVVLGPPKSAKDSAKVGGLHQRGTVYMPKRVLVPRPTAAERRDMTEAIRRHLTEGL